MPKRKTAGRPAKTGHSVPGTKPKAQPQTEPPTGTGSSKLAIILGLLQRPGGASIAELVEATRWQAHSVRGALAGALKKKGHEVSSDKSGGERRYFITARP